MCVNIPDYNTHTQCTLNVHSMYRHCIDARHRHFTQTLFTMYTHYIVHTLYTVHTHTHSTHYTVCVSTCAAWLTYPLPG